MGWGLDSQRASMPGWPGPVYGDSPGRDGSRRKVPVSLYMLPVPTLHHHLPFNKAQEQLEQEAGNSDRGGESKEDFMKQVLEQSFQERLGCK